MFTDRVLLGQTRNVGRHVSDGYAIAGPGVRHIAEKTEIVSTSSDHLEHGRRSVRR